MATTLENASALQQKLSTLFAYKAEWLREHIFELFEEPSYFPSIAASHPCVLIGGRGTGKTTVLRGLSYEGRFELAGRRPEDVPSWPYFGFYLRVDTNRVTAFSGPEVSQAKWNKIFGHYINVVLSDSVLSFLEWYERQADTVLPLTPQSLKRISRSLCIQDCDTLAALHVALGDALVNVEAYVNNVADSPPLALSMQGAPLSLIFAELKKLSCFSEKSFFFLIDEYENLSDDQQRVFNTLVKHASTDFTFKIGVKELGWRQRTTLNEHEELRHPADYELIRVSDELSKADFSSFARSVCNARLAKLKELYPHTIDEISDIFPTYTEEEEAVELGVHERLKPLVSLVKHDGKADRLAFYESLSPLQRYFVWFWAQRNEAKALTTLDEWRRRPHEWAGRFANYSHSTLYTLRRGLRGIHKYYC